MHVTMPWHISVRDQNEEVRKIVDLIREKYGECADLSITCDPCRDFSCRSCKFECNERKEKFTELLEWNINNLSENAQHGKVCENADE
jgi:hypothetical protein